MSPSPLLAGLPVVLALVGAFSMSSGVASAFENLQTWESESAPCGEGFLPTDWDAQAGTSVSVSDNNNCASYYVSAIESLNANIRFTLAVNDGDHDYAGFALGFVAGESTDAPTNYLLFNFVGQDSGNRGLVMVLMRRNQSSEDFYSFLSHTSVGLRATNLANAVRQDNGHEYQFDVTLTGQELTVDVDGNREFHVTAGQDLSSVPGVEASGTQVLASAVGGLAFYNAGQANATYGNVAVVSVAVCSDADSDGFGSPGSSVCENGAAEDCNDADASINPDAFEIPGDFVDDDCNGSLGSASPCCDWASHGKYVRSVAHAVEQLVSGGFITQAEGDALVSSAAQSQIGRQGYVAPQCEFLPPPPADQCP